MEKTFSENRKGREEREGGVGGRTTCDGRTGENARDEEEREVTDKGTEGADSGRKEKNKREHKP